MEDLADFDTNAFLENAHRSADLDAILYGADDDYEGF